MLQTQQQQLPQVVVELVAEGVVSRSVRVHHLMADAPTVVQNS